MLGLGKDLWHLCGARIKCVLRTGESHDPARVKERHLAGFASLLFAHVCLRYIRAPVKDGFPQPRLRLQPEDRPLFGRCSRLAGLIFLAV